MKNCIGTPYSTIVTAQAIYSAQEEKNKAYDMDVYVLLPYHYLDRGLNIPMVMQSPKKGRAEQMWT